MMSQKTFFSCLSLSISISILFLRPILMRSEVANATENSMPDTCWQSGNGKGNIKNYGIDRDGHTEAISRITFSPDGNFLVSAGLDGPISDKKSPIKYFDRRKSSNAIKVWDLAANSGEGKLDRTKLGPSEASIFAIAFSPDGKFFVDGSSRGKIRLWDWKNNKLISETRINYLTISDIKFSRDSSKMISIPADIERSIKIWNLSQNSLIEKMNLNSAQIVRTAAFSPDGKLLATAGMGKYIEFWDVNSGRSIRKVNEAHEIFSIAFSPDGRYIASAGWDTKITLRPVEDIELPKKEFLGNFGRINSIDFSPNGRYILSGSSDKSVKLWDVQTSKLIEKYTFSDYKDPIQDSVTSVVFHPSGRRFALSTADNRLKIFSTKCEN